MNSESLRKHIWSLARTQLGCLPALRNIILAMHRDITETVKYGMPCFLYKGKPFCYLWTDKTTYTPYILMVDGHKMQHPLLVRGDRTRMSVLNIDPLADTPVEIIEEVLKEGLLLRDGIESV